MTLVSTPAMRGASSKMTVANQREISVDPSRALAVTFTSMGIPLGWRNHTVSPTGSPIIREARSFEARVLPTRWSKVAVAASLSVARIGMRG